MIDNSKRIDVNGTTLYQLGYESLLPNDDKIYGLSKGTNGRMSAKLVEITGFPTADELLTGTASEVADLDNAADLAAVITKVNDLLAELRDRGVIATAGE